MSAATTSAPATVAARCRRFGFPFLNKTESTADHASNRFAGLRIMGQRIVAHALLQLEAASFIGFININWHGAQFRQVPSSWQGGGLRKLKVGRTFPAS